MTNSIREIPISEGFFIIGSNTTENHPVIGSMIKKAVIHGGKKLVVADPRRIELAKYADVFLQILPGTNIALLNGLMHVILRDGLHDAAYVQSRCEGFEALEQTLQKYTPEHAAQICGLQDPGQIVEAARLLAVTKPMALYYCMGITQFKSGVNGVKSVANLQMLLGNLGVPGGGVNPLRGQSNVQGACDMGGLPNVLTAYQPVTSADARKKFEQAWGVPALPDKPGLTIVESLNAALDGKVRALYVMGENPALSDPNQHHVIEALEALELLIVQDISLTETAAYAHVVLPSYSFLEKEGTVSNTERRVQLMHRVVEPVGDVREDWWITQALANRLGATWDFRSAEEIYDEMRRVTPSYAGMTYARVDRELLQWPCPTPEHPGTQYLHRERFARGLGLLSAIEYTPPAEEVDPEYPLVLTTGRLLEHFHTGTMSRNSKILNEIVSEPHVEIGPNDAQNYDIADGEIVAVSTRRGSIRLKAHISDRPKPNVLFVPFHFKEACANVLTIDALDPICKIPELKVCACKLEKVYPREDGL